MSAIKGLRTKKKKKKVDKVHVIGQNASGYLKVLTADNSTQNSEISTSGPRHI